MPAERSLGIDEGGGQGKEEKGKEPSHQEGSTHQYRKKQNVTNGRPHHLSLPA